MTEKLRLCRACLDTNIVMYNIYDKGLADTYANFVGVPISATMRVPSYFCEQCFQLLTNVEEFKSKCVKSLQLLQDLIAKKQLAVFFVNKVEEQNRLQSKLATSNPVEPSKPQPSIVVDEKNIQPVHSTSEKPLPSHCTILTHKPKRNDTKKNEVKIENASSYFDVGFESIDHNTLNLMTVSKEEGGEEVYFVNDEMSDYTGLKWEEDIKQDNDGYNLETIKIEYSTVSDDNKNASNNVEIGFDDGDMIKSDDERHTNDEHGSELKTREISKCKTVGRPRKKVVAKKKVATSVSCEKPRKLTGKTAMKTVFNHYIESKSKAMPPIEEVIEREGISLTKEEDEWIKKTVTFFDNFSGTSGMPSWNYANKRMNYLEDFMKKYNVDVKFLTKEEQVKDHEETKPMYAHLAYQCQFCYQGYGNKDTYDTHMLVHDPSAGDFKCDICGARQKTNCLLNQHIKGRHSTRFICRLCGKVTKNYNTAQQHYYRHGESIFRCEPCGKTYKNVTNYCDHMSKAHNKDATKCPLCAHTLRGGLGLKIHMARKHRKAVSCNSCNFYFETKTALIKHLENSIDGACDSRISSCKKCGEGFECEDEYKKHYEQHRYEVYSCVKCNASYTCPNSLSGHWKVCHLGKHVKGMTGARGGRGGGGRAPGGGEAKYVCECCGRGFRFPKCLEVHRRLHTGERPFQCPHCPKAFRIKLSLTSHLPCHTDERPHQCTMCPKSFRQAHHLKAHIWTHTLERPFACKLCPKTYRGDGVLREHVNTVHKGLPGRQRNKKIEQNKC